MKFTIQNTMKQFLITFMFLNISLPIGFVWAGEQSVQWEQLSTSLEDYFDYPSSENAKEAYQYLPSLGRVRTYGLKIEREVPGLSYKNMRILERQVISKDIESIRLAFRLLSIADGAYAEELDIMLGKLIRIDPKLFLEEMIANQTHAGHLAGLLGNYGEDFVDRFNAQCLENRQRQKSLESVIDSSLKEIREECIQELDRQWQKSCN